MITPIRDCTMAYNLPAIEKVVVWLNDPDVNKYLEARHQHWDIISWRSWYSKQEAHGRIVFWITEDSAVVGTLTIGPIDALNRNAPLGLMIGKEYWGKGFGAKALREAVKLGFQKYKLHKVWAGILSENVPSIMAFQRAGFKHEGILREQRKWGDKWADEVRMGVAYG